MKNDFVTTLHIHVGFKLGTRPP